MTKFIETKFKKSDDQTNIDKYKVAENITEYPIISKLILQRIIITNFCGPVSHLRTDPKCRKTSFLKIQYIRHRDNENKLSLYFNQSIFFMIIVHPSDFLTKFMDKIALVKLNRYKITLPVKNLLVF